MNILYPAGAKRNWFDRNPLVNNYSYAASAVAPHVSTNRITFTPAAGRRYFLQSIYLYLNRATAAGAVGEVSINALLYDSATYAVLLNNVLNDNTVNKPVFIQFAFDYYIFAPCVLYVSTYDNSTGGTVNYTGNLSIVSFDG